MCLGQRGDLTVCACMHLCAYVVVPSNQMGVVVWAGPVLREELTKAVASRGVATGIPPVSSDSAGRRMWVSYRWVTLIDHSATKELAVKLYSNSHPSFEGCVRG